MPFVSYVQQALRGNGTLAMMFCVVLIVLFLYCCVGVFLPDRGIVFCCTVSFRFEGPN